MTKIPVVSIITPAFNAAGWIAETIESVQAQTFTDWELLITDDGSTDDTASVVQRFASADTRIRCITQQNGGMGKARNTAIAAASGKYLAFIDSDDLWLPEKLQKQVEAMESTGADLVYTAGWTFRNRPDNREDFWEVPAGLQGYGSLFVKQLYGFTVPVLSVLVKTEKVTALGGFEESKLSHFAADYQMWLRIMDAGALFFGMKEGLFLYRLHDKQATHTDSLALGPVLWAMHFAQLKSITPQEKQLIMERRLNRYIIHQCDVIKMRELRKFIRLYSKPLQLPLRAVTMQLISLFGKNALKRWGYRNLDLQGEGQEFFEKKSYESRQYT